MVRAAPEATGDLIVPHSLLPPPQHPALQGAQNPFVLDVVGGPIGKLGQAEDAVDVVGAASETASDLVPVDTGVVPLQYPPLHRSQFAHGTSVAGLTGVGRSGTPAEARFTLVP